MIKTWAVIDDATQKLVNLIVLDLDANPDWPVPDGCSLVPPDDPRFRKAKEQEIIPT